MKRYKSSVDAAEKGEEEVKAEKRALQKEVFGGGGWEKGGNGGLG